MISDKVIVINRCQSLLCRRVVILPIEGARLIEVLETGSESCEHVYDPNASVKVIRDVLILHALWTAGRHAVDAGMDVQAHILADRLGFAHGDDVPLSKIPLQLVDPTPKQLSWEGMATATRAAMMIRDQARMTSGEIDLWVKIAKYLARWQHHVL